MTLPDPKLNTKNPPLWFESYRKIDQARLDNLYQHDVTNGLDAYEAAKAGWLDDQTRKRDLSADPEHYVPAQFSRPVPRREVSDWDDERGVPYTWQMDPDPNIHPPVLPPYVKPQASGGGGFVQIPDPKDAALFALLGQIRADVAAIKAKVGA